VGSDQHAGADQEQGADHGLPERLEFDRHPRQAALGGARERDVLRDEALRHRARHRPLHAHRREHGPQHLSGLHLHAQPVKRDEMRQRHHVGRYDRLREDLVGDGDVGKGHDRHPDQIEDGDDDAQALGAEPVQPAEAELAALVRGEAARARQEAPP
ncbi:hypothetical protein KXW38_001984, partial [Aspergillus fumigatus]